MKKIQFNHLKHWRLLYFSKYVLQVLQSGSIQKTGEQMAFQRDKPHKYKCFQIQKFSNYIQIFPKENTTIKNCQQNQIFLTHGKVYFFGNAKSCSNLFIQGLPKWWRVGTPSQQENLAKVAQRIMEDHHLHWSSTILGQKGWLCTSRKISSFYSPRAAAKLSNDTWEEEQEKDQKNWWSFARGSTFLPHI